MIPESHPRCSSKDYESRRASDTLPPEKGSSVSWHMTSRELGRGNPRIWPFDILIQDQGRRQREGGREGRRGVSVESRTPPRRILLNGSRHLCHTGQRG